MLMIRLQRFGRKKIPIFRVVVTEKQNSTKSGRYFEAVGSYDPRRDGIRQFKADRIKHWISKGAKLSGTLNNLLIDEKIIEGKKMGVTAQRRVLKEASTAVKPPEAEAKNKAPDTALSDKAKTIPPETVVPKKETGAEKVEAKPAEKVAE